jgi:hypothetical protein
MDGGKLEQAGHGKAFPNSAPKRLERAGKKLGFIAEGESDTDLTPVYAQDASSDRNGWAHRKSVNRKRQTVNGGSSRTRSPRPRSSVTVHRLYCAMVAKNSLLFFVRFMRSRRNSRASTGGMSAKKLRSKYTRLSSSLSIRSSSLRVEVRWISIAG